MTCLLWLATVTLAAETPPPMDYDVFVLAGQSNMDGRGKVADLTAEQRQPIERAWIYYRNPPVESAGWQPLGPGYSDPPGFRGKLPSSTFGPELGFGRAYSAARPGRGLALIKISRGGTSLWTEWLPGEPGQPTSQGHCYRDGLESVARALKALAGRGGQAALRGVLWHQGESDSQRTEEHYQQMLTTFITHLRRDLGRADLPFVIGEVYDNGNRDAVRAAQAEVAQTVPHCALAPASGLTTSDGGTHFDAASQLKLGQRLAEAWLKLDGSAPPTAGGAQD